MADGLSVHQLVCIERALSTFDEELLGPLRAGGDRFEAFDAFSSDRWWRRCIERRRRPRQAQTPRIGRALRSRLRALSRPELCGAVLLTSPALLPLLEFLDPATRVWLDLPWVDDLVMASARKLGREDLASSLSTIRPDSFHRHGISTCLARCTEDREALLAAGCESRILVLPPLVSRLANASPMPRRPPRLLFVGSETPANLDGLRWFRRRVLPRIERRVPSLRTRVVGDIGRFVEPGADLERLGWLDRLDGEYDSASVVILPLRVGGRVRRRVVESIARGKALVATPAAAQGLGLVHRESAMLADSEDGFAQAVVDLLEEDILRQRIEDGARQLAAQRFRVLRSGVMAPLLALEGFAAECSAGPILSEH